MAFSVVFHVFDNFPQMPFLSLVSENKGSFLNQKRSINVFSSYTRITMCGYPISSIAVHAHILAFFLKTRKILFMLNGCDTRELSPLLSPPRSTRISKWTNYTTTDILLGKSPQAMPYVTTKAQICVLLAPCLGKSHHNLWIDTI